LEREAQRIIATLPDPFGEQTSHASPAISFGGRVESILGYHIEGVERGSE
jgi:hypothetical protein